MFFTIDLFLASYILTPIAWVFYLFFVTFYPTSRDSWGYYKREIGNLDGPTFKIFLQRIVKTPFIWFFFPIIFATPLIVAPALAAFALGIASGGLFLIMFYRQKKGIFTFSMYDLKSRFEKKGE